MLTSSYETPSRTHAGRHAGRHWARVCVCVYLLHTAAICSYICIHLYESNLSLVAVCTSFPPPFTYPLSRTAFQFFFISFLSFISISSASFHFYLLFLLFFLLPQFFYLLLHLLLFLPWAVYSHPHSGNLHVKKLCRASQCLFSCYRFTTTTTFPSSITSQIAAFKGVVLT